MPWPRRFPRTTPPRSAGNCATTWRCCNVKPHSESAAASPRCACVKVCGDVPEASDHPNAHCKGLPAGVDLAVEAINEGLSEDEKRAINEGIERRLRGGF